MIQIANMKTVTMILASPRPKRRADEQVDPHAEQSESVESGETFKICHREYRSHAYILPQTRLGNKDVSCFEGSRSRDSRQATLLSHHRKPLQPVEDA